MELKDLKKLYGVLQKKYKLPNFKELNDCFEIDRVDKDTDNLLKEIRKNMMDKIIGYKRFIEMMIAPSNAPPMFMIFLKEVKQEERELIENAYKDLTELEMDSFELEVDYDEKKESEVIKKISNTWNDMRPDLRIIVKMMRRNWNSSSEKKRNKDYFG